MTVEREHRLKLKKAKKKALVVPLKAEPRNKKASSSQHTKNATKGELSYGSVCSGIEAASVAWHVLGFKPAWFSEIEPFPSAVLADRFPNVHNHGDFTAIRKRIARGKCEAPDILVGGTPCQAFSMAGLRNSLDDKRGQLSLHFCLLADAIDRKRLEEEKKEAIVLWENVPGVLSTKDNAFGCFLAGLAGETDPLVPAGKKWTNAGYVSGPKRTVAWRILDAQYFGVAQRRRRVFVVASARTDIDPREILFEFDGVRRDFAPRREAAQGFASVAGTLTANGGGVTRRAGNANELDFCIPMQRLNIPNSECSETLVACANQTTGFHSPEVVAVGTDCYNGNITGDVACTMGTLGSSTTGTGPTVMTQPKSVNIMYQSVTGALCASDYKGVGNQYISDRKCIVTRKLTKKQRRLLKKQDARNRQSSKKLHQPFPETADCLYAAYGTKWNGNAAAFNGSLFAFSSKDYGNDATRELAPTLRSMGHNKSHANGGGQLAVTTTQQQAQRSFNAPSLSNDPKAHTGLRVRRLTPVECERLQGFPDNWTSIRWRGAKRKDCPDGPRYKACGNSMAVPVMRWLGFRIQLAVVGAMRKRIAITKSHETEVTKALRVRKAIGEIWKGLDRIEKLVAPAQDDS